MKRFLHFAAILVVSLLASGLVFSPSASLAVAQDLSAPTDGLMIAKITGTLEAIGGDRLKVKSDDGQQYFAVLGPRTTLRYRGTADVKFLRPGLLVRFSAPFHPQTGVPQAPISDLEVFRVVKQRRMSREQMQNQTPGIYPVVPKKGDREKPRQTNPSGAQNFKIVGQLRALQADKMQIVAGNRPILVQLDPAAKISIACGDTLFCMPGDTVEVTGLKNSSNAVLVQAQEVEIQGAQPLGMTADSKNTRKPGKTQGDAPKTEPDSPQESK